MRNSIALLYLPVEVSKLRLARSLLQCKLLHLSDLNCESLSPMDFSGQQTIPAPRALVWQKLNDMTLLQACITGCEAITPMDGEVDKYDVAVTAAVGPVKAKFKGKLALSDKVENQGYRLQGEGNGGMAGFGKMGATVTLVDAEHGATLLTYEAQASVGGKMAQIGARLIQATTNKFADDFFKKFNAAVSAQSQQGASDGSAAEPAETMPEQAHKTAILEGMPSTPPSQAALHESPQANAQAAAQPAPQAPPHPPIQPVAAAPASGLFGRIGAWFKRVFS
jgi:uncharacterized protein